MDLSSKQREELQNALIFAFPDKTSLEQMLSHGLNKNLDAIAGGSNLNQVIFNLIKKAEAENWVKDLIDAAHNSNPGNPNLKAIIAFYSPTDEKTNLKKWKNSKLEKILEGDELSEVGADYTKLAQLLDNKNFKAANDETVEKMLWVARREKEGYLRAQDIENFPIKDLLTIDKIWLAASNNRFGFSVQKEIWIDLGGKEEYDWATYLQFIERVGWKQGDLIFGENLCWDLRADKGHLPIFSYCTDLASDKIRKGQLMDDETRNDFYRLLGPNVCEAQKKGILDIVGVWVEELRLSENPDNNSAFRVIRKMYPLPLIWLTFNNITNNITDDLDDLSIEVDY